MSLELIRRVTEKANFAQFRRVHPLSSFALILAQCDMYNAGPRMPISSMRVAIRFHGYMHEKHESCEVGVSGLFIDLFLGPLFSNVMPTAGR